jgi:SAM-dependent methyltransferase
MRTPQEVRARVERVTSYPPQELERIYRKYFLNPPHTLRYLCEKYGFDRRRVLDVACHYGYYLIHFGEGSTGIDATDDYLRFAREMGFPTFAANIEESLPTFDEPFDGLLFSGTLEEVLSPHVMLMRFRRLLKPDGLLALRVPSVPPRWFDKLLRLRMDPGYDALAHIYFFTPRILQLMLVRAGYEVLDVFTSALMTRPYLRPLSRLLLPFSPSITLVARPLPNWKYPPIRAMRFLPSWAADLGPYHLDYQDSAGS